MMRRGHRLFICFSVFLLHAGMLMGQSGIADSVVTLSDVVVLASRKPEAFMKSPASVQVLGKRFFRQSAAPSFFDALSHVKGVQMITPSMGFRVLNARGFNNTTNVRFVQMVDGLDVQSPHISSPIGNALGPTDLDIEKVEILPGVAATLYGMNTVNGLADFTTRDPFTDPGLSFMQKTGISHLGDDVGPRVFSETALRYARSFRNRWALKLNLSYVNGYDWIADDRTDLNPNANASTGLSGKDNPAADPVNGYGNESSNRRTLPLDGSSYVVARTGYYEREVTSYALHNLKGDLTLRWRSKKGSVVSYTGRVALMDNVYQRANRFRLQDYLLQQHGLQFISADLRVNLYYNTEQTGDSYNLRSMAENIDRSWKSDDQWFADYANAYRMQGGGTNTLAQRHANARVEADRGRYLPGTPAFASALERLQQVNNWDMGAALKVRAAFVHLDLKWDATGKMMKALKDRTGIDMVAGLDFRQHILHPDGNYFINPDPQKTGKDLFYKKAGVYLSLQKDLFRDALRIGFALRADKNDYFKTYFSPRFTSVWQPDKKTTLRFSAQLGYRFPVIFEAFSNVNSGGVKRVGGLPVMSNGIFENGWLQQSIDRFQAAVLERVNRGVPLDQSIRENAGLLQKSPYTYLEPEKIRSYELGFRRIFLSGHLLVDMDVYLNQYNSFIAQVNMNVPNTADPDSIPYYLYARNRQKRYRMWTNSVSLVRNYGFSVGVSYRHPRSVAVSANINFARLQKTGEQDGLEDGFNTPAWNTSVSVSSNELMKRWQLGLNWRWQDRFDWVSFLVSGPVPAYQTLDAFVEHGFRKIPIRVKMGGSNVLNRAYRSFLGGPSVGGFYYMTFVYGMN